jgi:TPR repeat protein
MIDELLRDGLSRPERLDLRQSLRAAPWLWPDDADAPAMTRARQIADAELPTLQPGEVALVTVNRGASSLWMTSPAAGTDRSIQARLGPKASAAWANARSAAASVLPGRRTVLETIPAEPPDAWHLYSLPLVPESSYVVERVVDGESLGLSLFLAQASSVFGVPVAGDLVASAAVDARGAVGKVEAIGQKLTLILRSAPRLTRLLVAASQLEEAVRAAGECAPDARVHPLDRGARVEFSSDSYRRTLDLIPVHNVNEALTIAFGARTAGQTAAVLARTTRRLVHKHRIPLVAAAVVLTAAAVFFTGKYQQSVRQSELQGLRDNVRVVLENAGNPKGQADFERQWRSDVGARWRAEAERGTPEAQFLAGLGYWLFDAAKEPEALGHAMRLFESAAQQGFTPAETQLGQALLRGEGVRADPERGLRLLERAAASNDTFAMHNLALAYDDCRGVDCDRKLAYEWDRKAADLGLVLAQTDTGMRLWAGRGVIQDLLKGCEWFTRAAAQGDAEGIRGRNVCARAQIGRAHTDAPVRTLADHRSLCQNGRTDSCNVAGRMSAAAGQISEAAILYRAGCELRYQTACVDLGRLAIDHPEVVTDVDDTRARKYFEYACSTGIKSGCVARALLESQQRAGLSDSRHAYVQFQSWCREGDLESCFYVAVNEWNADPARRPVLAKTYASLCDEGLMHACEKWAQALDGRTKGIANDPREAERAFELACGAGLPGSCSSLALLLKTGKRDAADITRARTLVSRACTMGDAQACIEFAAQLAEEDTPSSRQQLERVMALLQQWCRYHSVPTCARLFGGRH